MQLVGKVTVHQISKLVCHIMSHLILPNALLVDIHQETITLLQIDNLILTKLVLCLQQLRRMIYCTCTLGVSAHCDDHHIVAIMIA